MSDPNAVAGFRAQNVLQYLAECFVDDAEGIEITTSTWKNRVSLSLSVAPDDMGRIIGRRGRTAQALRAIVRAAGAIDQQDTFLDIVD
jgi:uncharacterized protein